jgi:hypothetical protein
MNIDDPKLTAYALDELDQPERSAIAFATGDSPEMQRFVAETKELARALRSQYRLELQRESVRPATLTAIRDDAFWSKAGPLAIAALVAVLAVVGAVLFSNSESRLSSLSRSGLPSHPGANRQESTRFAPVEAEDAALANQNEKFEPDAGPYAFTGERPIVSAISRPRASVPLVVINSASYFDVRRSINSGSLPPRESVRIEELINHFQYDYPDPAAGESFSLNVDVVSCPWEPTHRLVRIGVKGRQGVVVRADSKIEVEFNPRLVASYRLIGYDRQEAQNSRQQNLGTHSVPPGYTLTTLYEVVPIKRVHLAPDTPTFDAAKERSGALLTAKLEVNKPEADSAVGYMQRTVSDPGSDFAAASSDLKFAAAVAEFGMILRGSEYKGNGSLQQVIEWAQQGTGADVNGYRSDFIELVRRTQTLKRS